MTRSVYVIGGAGSGKSTFTAQLLESMDAPLGPLESLYAAPNARGSTVTLRGHRAGAHGLYLGVMRDVHPGTDGLDKASSNTGRVWMEQDPPSKWVLAEGQVLATRPFLTALAAATELLLVHLTVEPWLAELRFAQRGTTQSDSFVKTTVTRSANLAREFGAHDVDSGDGFAWEVAQQDCLKHLRD